MGRGGGGALAASESAPVLHRDGGADGYVHSQRMERRVPPLALVPMDQLQRRREEEEEEVDERRRQRKPVWRKKRRDQVVEEDGGEEAKQQFHREEQQRLGERFLGMMALLARLRRMDLEGSEISPTKKQPTSTTRVDKALSPLQKLVEMKRKGVGGGITPSSTTLSLSPHRKPEPVVNVATAPLREHLTFEISMLLPPPMDTRQSELHSPIHRLKRPKRLKKKRRRKRPTGSKRVDGKRTWQTSHVTWVPHASADYAQARAAAGMAATSGSKLMAKFAALRTNGSAPTASSQRPTYLIATGHNEQQLPIAPPLDGGRSDGDERDEEEEATGEDSGEEMVGGGGDAMGATFDLILEEDAEDNEDDDASSASADEEEEESEETLLPDLLPHTTLSVLRYRTAHRAPAPLRPVQTHQAAWISPELRTWLVHTGLFRTTTSPIPSSPSS